MESDTKELHALLENPLTQGQLQEEEEQFYDCEELKDNSETTPTLSAEEEAKCTEEALQFKEEGNRFFIDKQYSLAMQQYSMAIELCPRTEACKEHRAVFHSNRAACHMYLEEFTEAAEDCTEAIQCKPDYLKAYVRRAQALQKLDKLEDALNDVRKILEMDPSNAYARGEVTRLEVQCKERTEKMKEEALGKLKELGNSILGNFGMSLDNFKMTQDPNTGGYSVSFQR